MLLAIAWVLRDKGLHDKAFLARYCVGYEIFERYIGESTPIGLARGLNAQWTDGGLLYAPPFR